MLRFNMAYKNENERAKKSAYMREYRSKNLAKLNAKNKQWRLDNPELARSNTQRWLSENKERNKACKAAYALKHADRLRVRRRENAARRRETDDNFRIRDTLHARLNNALRKSGAVRAANTKTLIGCDLAFLKGFLEARFSPGMTWANHGLGKGKWHIDHRIPCAEFDLRDPAQQRSCFSYTNLQPMWSADNRRKGAKRPATHQPELI